MVWRRVRQVCKQSKETLSYSHNGRDKRYVRKKNRKAGNHSHFSEGAVLELVLAVSEGAPL